MFKVSSLAVKKGHCHKYKGISGNLIAIIQNCPVYKYKTFPDMNIDVTLGPKLLAVWSYHLQFKIF